MPWRSFRGIFGVYRQPLIASKDGLCNALFVDATILGLITKPSASISNKTFTAPDFEPLENDLGNTGGCLTSGDSSWVLPSGTLNSRMRPRPEGVAIPRKLSRSHHCHAHYVHLDPLLISDRSALP